MLESLIVGKTHPERMQGSLQTLLRRGCYQAAREHFSAAETSLLAAFDLSTKVGFRQGQVLSAWVLSYVVSRRRLDALKERYGAPSLVPPLDSAEALNAAMGWTQTAKTVASGDNHLILYAQWCFEAVLGFQATTPERRSNEFGIDYDYENFLFQHFGVRRPAEDTGVDDRIVWEVDSRDYIRGLRLAGRWVNAIEHHSLIHQRGIFDRPRCPVITPAVASADEAGLGFLTHTDQDPIGVAIQFYEEEPFFVILETPVIDLGRLAAWSRLPEWNISTSESFLFHQPYAIWELTFGVGIMGPMRRMERFQIEMKAEICTCSSKKREFEGKKLFRRVSCIPFP